MKIDNKMTIIKSYRKGLTSRQSLRNKNVIFQWNSKNNIDRITVYFFFPIKKIHFNFAIRLRKSAFKTKWNQELVQKRKSEVRPHHVMITWDSRTGSARENHVTGLVSLPSAQTHWLQVYHQFHWHLWGCGFCAVWRVGLAYMQSCSWPTMLSRQRQSRSEMPSSAVPTNCPSLSPF